MLITQSVELLSSSLDTAMHGTLLASNLHDFYELLNLVRPRPLRNYTNAAENYVVKASPHNGVITHKGLRQYESALKQSN